ncbi:alpha-D-ribose 1-methylphosphonate 5-triphosphate diphosphatase [Benzoatithermus flavus]|uniref:Alpha-D-ribose 1-methylphosphonate 5-triphosphate diphosphatase n=1 Tax=Benzoatithermus flavus TaxID=3108223 RepID=A0ABU8XWV8_9PROT
MREPFVLTNARIVTEDRVVTGSLVVRDGLVEAVDEGPSRTRSAIDLEGDWLLPGLVELHTDNLERQFTPRPGVRWPADAAMLTHDAQVAAAGITTVCDAICVGFYGGKSERLEYLNLSIEVLRRAQRAGALKAEHFLHLRLELTDPHMLELFEPLRDEPSLRLVSLMDHTPGQRQWRDLDRLRGFHLGREVKDEAEFQAMVARRIEEQRTYVERHRAAVLRLLDGHRAVRASHDDTTEAHVAEASACGCAIAEFPTTLEAARAARAAGMSIVMGAPNLVIGGSHSGNVAAAELVEHGLLDVFSSDYVPASLLQAAFLLREGFGIPMPDAIAPVTRIPADLLGLGDRGRIAPGARADLVRVREIGVTPTVLAVWREGWRIA